MKIKKINVQSGIRHISYLILIGLTIIGISATNSYALPPAHHPNGLPPQGRPDISDFPPAVKIPNGQVPPAPEIQPPFRIENNATDVIKDTPAIKMPHVPPPANIQPPLGMKNRDPELGRTIYLKRQAKIATIEAQRLISLAEKIRDDRLSRQKKLNDSLTNSNQFSPRHDGLKEIARKIQNHEKVLASVNKLRDSHDDFIMLDLSGDGSISMAVKKETVSRVLAFEEGKITEHIEEVAGADTIVIDDKVLRTAVRRTINLDHHFAEPAFAAVQTQDGTMRIVSRREFDAREQEIRLAKMQNEKIKVRPTVRIPSESKQIAQGNHRILHKKDFETLPSVKIAFLKNKDHREIVLLKDRKIAHVRELNKYDPEKMRLLKLRPQIDNGKPYPKPVLQNGRRVAHIRGVHKYDPQKIRRLKLRASKGDDNSPPPAPSSPGDDSGGDINPNNHRPGELPSYPPMEDSDDDELASLGDDKNDQPPAGNSSPGDDFNADPSMNGGQWLIVNLANPSQRRYAHSDFEEYLQQPEILVSLWQKETEASFKEDPPLSGASPPKTHFFVSGSKLDIQKLVESTAPLRANFISLKNIQELNIEFILLPENNHLQTASLSPPGHVPKLS